APRSRRPRHPARQAQARHPLLARGRADPVRGGEGRSEVGGALRYSLQTRTAENRLRSVLGMKISAPSVNGSLCHRWSSSWMLRPSSQRHCHLLLEVLHVAKDRGYSQYLAIAAIAHQAITCREAALDFETVPFISVPDVVNGHVVMLAPEERDAGKSLFQSEYVARRGLALTLRHNPMLDKEILA